MKTPKQFFAFITLFCFHIPPPPSDQQFFLADIFPLSIYTHYQIDIDWTSGRAQKCYEFVGMHLLCVHFVRLFARWSEGPLELYLMKLKGIKDAVFETTV